MPIGALLMWRASDAVLDRELLSRALAATLHARKTLESVEFQSVLGAITSDTRLLEACRDTPAFTDFGAYAWIAAALLDSQLAHPVAMEWVESGTGHPFEQLRRMLLRSGDLARRRNERTLAKAFSEAMEWVEGTALPVRAESLKVAQQIQREVYDRHFAGALDALRRDPPEPNAEAIRLLEDFEAARAVESTDAQRSLRAGRQLESRMRDSVENHFDALRTRIVEAAELARDLLEARRRAAPLSDVLVLRKIDWRAVGVSEPLAAAATEILEESL